MPRPKTKFNLKEVERLAGLGLTNDEIAYAAGCSPATFYVHKAGNSELLESIQRGKAKALAEVANVVYEAAVKNRDVRAALEYLKRRGDGWKDSAVKVELNQPAPQSVDELLSDEQKVRMSKAYVDKYWDLLPDGDKHYPIQSGSTKSPSDYRKGFS